MTALLLFSGLNAARAQTVVNITTDNPTWSVPSGVFSITVEAWGGGAGGGGGTNSSHSGGGGGAYTRRTFDVTPLETLQIDVGAGGTGGNSSTQGQSGFDSTVTRNTGSLLLVRAKGGSVNNAGAAAAGGAAAACLPDNSSGGPARSGGAGSVPVSNNGGGGGSSATLNANGLTATATQTGASSAGTGSGVGATGASSNGAGGVAGTPGGGGGGKGNGNSTGSTGGNGLIRITYTPAVAPSVAGVPASQNYNEGVTGNLLLASAGTLTDTDSPNLDGGYLRLEITANEEASEDRLWISEINNITIENNLVSSNGVLGGSATVKHGTTTIGTITAANSGFNGAPLQIDFNASATPAMAQDLLRSVFYRNTDAVNAVANTRTILITANDSDLSVTASTAITVINAPFGITYASDAWTPILSAAKYDPSEDQQATSGPDLVGADGVPMLYGKYDDMGTPADFSDDIVAFRARVDDSLTNTGSYSGYVFVGMDFELDGDIDVFFALEGTSKGTRVYVYETSDFCTSPSTTGIGAAFLVPNHVTATDANYSPVHTIEGTTVAAANSYPGNDGETDYFISFKFNFADLKTVLDPRPLNQAVPNGGVYTTISDLEVNALQVGMSVITPYRFILATATQNNALNSDFGGVGRLSRTDRNQSWEDLGLFDDDDGGVTFGNAAPVFTSGSGATASYTIQENSTPVATLTASDPDGDDAIFSIRTGTGHGIDGGLFQINPFTGALSFITAPNYEIPSDADTDNEYLVTVEISDGKGGITTQLVSVYVTDQPEGANAVPAITSNGAGAAATLSFAENGTGTVTTVTAIDAGDLSGISVVPATLTYSISGGADAAAFSIVPGTGVLSFVSAPDYEAQNSYVVHVTVTDANGATDTQILTVNITNVSEAPVLTADTPTLATITEDETSNAGLRVKDLLNLNVIDADFGATPAASADDVGIAITSMNAGNGTWEYSTDGGLNWAPFDTEINIVLEEDDFGVITPVYNFVSAGALSASNALLLRPEDFVRFKPDAKNSTTANFTFLAWDQSSGGPGSHENATVTGGTTAFSTVSDTADITVTDLNDAPTVAAGPLNLPAQVDYVASPGATAISAILADAGLSYGDVDTGAVSGLAVTGKTGAGTWQFHNGSVWANINGVDDDNALLLLPAYQIRYLPAYVGPDGGEIATLTLRGWDRTTGTAGASGDASPNGGTTAYSSGTSLLRVEIDEDDRQADVGLASVNEASPWAVFTVTGIAGQKLEFSVTDVTTTGMNGTDLEYHDGTDWQPYTPGGFVELSGTTLLVRVAITALNERDSLDEGSETFTLVATTTGGVASTGGTGTITDDGTGDVFLDGNETATPNLPTDLGYPALDDDRVLAVENPSTSETSQYLVIDVLGSANQPVKLTLQTYPGPGAAADISGFTLYYKTGVDGGGNPILAAYTPGSFVSLPPSPALPSTGILEVFVDISSEAEPLLEGHERFLLRAETTSGTFDVGVASIYDDGTVPGGADDRPITVSDVTANEASKYLIFTASARELQYVRFVIDDDAIHDPLFPDIDDFTLEYRVWNGTLGEWQWLPYDLDSPTPVFVQFPSNGDATLNEAATLLLRVNMETEWDADYEGHEVFHMEAYTTSGVVRYGHGTIADDGTGEVFLDGNFTSTPNLPTDPGYPALDDDRAPLVNSPEVNEGSDYAIFKVTGEAGQLLELELGLDADPLTKNANLTGFTLEYYDPVGLSWEPYTAGSFVEVPSGDVLLVRVNITAEQDTENEGPELFTLTAATTSGSSATGTGEIFDDGSSEIFLAGNTTGDPNLSTDLGYPALRDDDRRAAVGLASVNEASPWVVFTVTGIAGQKLEFSVTDVTTTGMNGTDLEYHDGTDWQPYTPGDFVELSGTTLLVRVAIAPEQDIVEEGSQTFTLVATTTGGVASTGGTGTIHDDGSGDVFLDGNETATPNLPTDPGYPALDDDRAPFVNSPEVNEASDYAIFKVTGEAGQLLELELGLDADPLTKNANLTGFTLEYYDPVGLSWEPYTAGSFVEVPAGDVLLVRVNITAEQDTENEGPELFTLSAATTSGSSAKGTGEIFDDGSSEIFLAGNTTGDPNLSTDPGYPALLDDDRRAAVGLASVNEASPWAVFTVTGIAGQKLEFSVTDVTTTGMNGTDLEYHDGTDWQPYTPGDFVELSGTTLLVRVAIAPEQDIVEEGSQTFTLVATTTGGVASTGGTGTIHDDGSGDVFLDGNETATPNLPTDPGYPALDDDRTPFVNSPVVNEASDYAIFKVTGEAGQLLELELGLDADPLTKNANLTGFTLEYYDLIGTSWEPYTAGSFVEVPAGDVLLVRVNITAEQDTENEGAEFFTLTAGTTSGTGYTGIGIIQDDGTGSIFLVDNTTGDPNLPTDPGYPAELDDDRATAPVVTTLGVANVTAYKATLQGEVNPGGARTDAWFEYSTDPTLGTGVTSTTLQDVADGTTVVDFEQALTGLTPETTYYYRAVAENSEGLVYGDIESFVSSYAYSSSEGVIGLPVGGEIYRPMPGPINEDGRVTTKFYAYLGIGGVTSADDTFVMSDGSGSMTVLAREGQTVTGLGGMRGFFENLRITDAGHSYIHENFSVRGRVANGVILATDNGLGSVGAPPLAVNLKTGDAAPEGGVFASLSGSPAVDENGMFHFGNKRSGTGINAKNDTGVWCNDSGHLTCLALEGSPVPGLVGVTGQPNAWYGNINHQVVTGAGHVVMITSFQNNPANRRDVTARTQNMAVMACNPANAHEPTVVVRKGLSVPGTGGKNWSNLLGVSTGVGGEIAVAGLVSGATRTTDLVLVRVGTDGIQDLILQEGVTVVPGTGLTVDRFAEKYLAANGDLFFRAFLRGAGVANDQVIGHWNPVTGLRVVLREGAFLPAPLAAQRVSMIGRFTVSPSGNVGLSVGTDSASVRHVVLREMAGTGTLEVVEYSGRPVWYRNQQYPILTLGMYEAYTNSNSTGGHGVGINDAGQMGLTLDLGGTRHVLKVYD